MYVNVEITPTADCMSSVVLGYGELCITSKPFVIRLSIHGLVFVTE